MKWIDYARSFRTGVPAGGYSEGYKEEGGRVVGYDDRVPAGGVSTEQARCWHVFECAVCGREFAARHPLARYCSRRCSNDAYIQRRRERRAVSREKVCEVCGKEFTAARSDAKTCSPACRQKAYRKRRTGRVVHVNFENWSAEELDLRKRVLAGEAVVINLKNSGHPNLRDWAEEQGKLVYIGNRQWQGKRLWPQSVWGNPNRRSKHGREGAVRLYREKTVPEKRLDKRSPELKGKVLGCWCAPEACHGDVLVRLAEAS